jgi:cytochrome c biogenesis protein CcmG, thiol:disulfide interchange protein DsbE
MSSRSFVILMAVLAVVGLLGYGLISKSTASISVGEAAPGASYERLLGSGSESLSDYRGRWVLLNFWASWCEPCRTEAPLLEQFQRRHRGPSFTVLGVDLDDAVDDARGFVGKYGLTYPQLRQGDGRASRDAYGMTGFPESFLITPDGDLALIRRGPVTDSFLEEQVAPLLDGSGKP